MATVGGVVVRVASGKVYRYRRLEKVLVRDNGMVRAVCGRDVRVGMIILTPYDRGEGDAERVVVGVSKPRTDLLPGA